jgi:DNA-directed RNA polymerase subunit RPC12/RpoP
MPVKKYGIIRCPHCGELVLWAAWIRTKCTTCHKKIDPKKARKIWLGNTPREVGHTLQRIKEQVAKEFGVPLEKGAIYVGRKA